MRDTTIARNYAEAFLELAIRADDTAGWGDLLQQLATAVRSNVALRNFLAAPQVPAEQKNQIVAGALKEHAPANFVRFIQALVKNRRQLLLPEINDAYLDLLDKREGRVHAQITFANETSDAEIESLVSRLGERIEAQVVPHVSVDERLIGGVVVRIGDHVYDGSVRRRLALLRRRMLAATGVTNATGIS
ncbi:MAG TPA: F0F1 ATP synthase subunit delta [Gemmatimonadales bacterium]|nr:F0F1 ATP synthase subunit delta [Gemmatimonadales bacterium]